MTITLKELEEESFRAAYEVVRISELEISSEEAHAKLLAAAQAVLSDAKAALRVYKKIKGRNKSHENP